MIGLGGLVRRNRGIVEACALAAAALVFVWLVGITNPPPPRGVNTDRLGPDNGEQVGEYIARAEASLHESGAEMNPKWALVSFDSGVGVRDSLDPVGEARVAQVLLRVSIDRVQTPVVSVGVPGTPESIVESPDIAATRLHGTTGQWDRQSRIDAASATSLASGCDCVVGFVVRAPGDVLQAIAAHPLVRAVEALPADAIGGRFAVRAFLPDYVDVVGPLPDDGDVPAG